MFIPKSPYSRIAFEAIKYYLKKGNLKRFSLEGLPSELYEIQRGCFVSLHKTDGELRGCIGTIEPRDSNLYEEIKHNAISAAFNDSRFSPLTKAEFNDLEVSVDVLTPPEQVFSMDDLDPLIYGVIVTDESYRKAVLLPSIPGIDTLEEQLRIVKRKAGLNNEANESLQFYRFSSTRYH